MLRKMSSLKYLLNYSFQPETSVIFLKFSLWLNAGWWTQMCRIHWGKHRNNIKGKQTWKPRASHTTLFDLPDLNSTHSSCSATLTTSYRVHVMVLTYMTIIKVDHLVLNTFHRTRHTNTKVKSRTFSLCVLHSSPGLHKKKILGKIK